MRGVWPAGIHRGDKWRDVPLFSEPQLYARTPFMKTVPQPPF